MIIMNKEIKKYKLLAAIRYLGDGFFYPFLSLYLVTTNLTEARIGFILSLTPIIGIICNPIYSLICKNMKITRNVLKVITVLEAVIIVLIGFTSNFYLITVLAVLLSLFGSSHYGLMDSLTSVYASENKVSYSSIRVFGSIAYILATTLGGFVIKLFGYDICFIISGILFVLCGFIYQWLMPITITNEKDKNKVSETEAKPSYKEIIKNKKLIIFIIFYVLIVGTTFTVDHFLSLYLESRGLSESDYGMVYSYFVLFEVIMIFILNRFCKKANPDKLLLIAAFCYVIRMLCNYLYLPVIVVVLVSGLRGITYAIMLHVTFSYIVSIVKEKNATRAIMLMTLIYSLYLGIGDNINGNIIEAYGYKGLYLVAMIVASMGFVLGIIRYLYNRKEVKSE